LSRHFQLSPARLCMACAQPALVAAPYLAIVWFLTRGVVWLSWLQLLVFMSLAALGYLVLAWFFATSAAERSIWIERCRSAPKRPPQAPREVPQIN
jgi:hypothetical protein